MRETLSSIPSTGREERRRGGGGWEEKRREERRGRKLALGSGVLFIGNGNHFQPGSKHDQMWV
jgi:hypothetical protein